MLFLIYSFLCAIFIIFVCTNICNNLQYCLDTDGLKSSRPDVARAADFFRKHVNGVHLARAHLVSILWNYEIYFLRLHVFVSIIIMYFFVSPSCTASVCAGTYSVLQDLSCVWAISSHVVCIEQVQCYAWCSWLFSLCQRRAAVKEQIPF